MTAYDRLVDKLRDHGSRVRDIGARAESQCPAHEDRMASLSVRGIEGQALVYCHAGCDTRDVLATLDLTLADLFDEPRGATYQYDDGRIVRRTPDKRFYQHGNTSGPAQLYHLSRLRASSDGGVFLVEGEKDVHAIESAGGIATTAPMGAKNFTRVDVTPLQGRAVTVVVDRDGAGAQWAADVRTALHQVAGRLRFVQAATGKDAADHIAATGEGKELGGWVDYQWPDEEPTFLDKLRAALVTTEGLDDIPEPEPLIRDVLYRNSTAWLIGPPAHGKSFVAIDFAGSVSAGEHWHGYKAEAGIVLYMVAEGLSGVRQRVRAWESSMGTPMRDVRFLPVAVQAANAPEWATFVELATELKPALVVVDTQARVTVGMEENSAKDMGEFVQRIEQLRVATGACVLVVHHQGRSGEHMRGSTALEGAATTIIRVKKDEDLVTVECTKQKDAPEFDKINLRLIPYESSAVLALTDTSSTNAALGVFSKEWVRRWWETFGSESVSASELLKADVVPESTFHRDKYVLVKAGYVAKEGTEARPRYRLTCEPGTGTLPTLPKAPVGAGQPTLSSSHTPLGVGARESSPKAVNGTPEPKCEKCAKPKWLGPCSCELTSPY